MFSTTTSLAAAREVPYRYNVPKIAYFGPRKVFKVHSDNYGPTGAYWGLL